MHSNEDSTCPKCNKRNASLCGVCCACGWHIAEGRIATEEEAAERSAALDRGIAQLKAALRKS